ncbi:MAG: DUF2806 domain-containing protein [Rhodospirillales bacterium]|nr:DUF2806 domain-containing protein [Rhodospirillales bacterium]
MDLIEIASSLGRPATLLVEKVSDATGAIYEPLHIRRMAKARADAAMIAAQSEIKITELQERAAIRRMQEEAKQQKNIDDVLAKALTQVSEDAKPDDMEEDWIINLFDKCRIVSDEQMQVLWSKVLAGEANAPGSYSKRTVNALADLNESEAALFTALGGFVCVIGIHTPVVLDEKAEIYNAHGINYNSMQYLDSAGLVRFGGISRTFRQLKKGDIVNYYDSALTVQSPGGKFGVDTGLVSFTTVGFELFPICGAKPVKGFLQYLEKQWKKHLAG